MANKYKNLQEQAREERKRRKMCEEKVAFKKKEEAAMSGQHIYKCPYCKNGTAADSRHFLLHR